MTLCLRPSKYSISLTGLVCTCTLRETLGRRGQSLHHGPLIPIKQISRSGCACTPAFGRAVRVFDPVLYAGTKVPAYPIGSRLARVNACPSDCAPHQNRKPYRGQKAVTPSSITS